MHAHTIIFTFAGLLCTTIVIAEQPRAIIDAEPGLTPRQQQACDTAASSVLSSIPTGTGAFASFLASITGAVSPTRVCQIISALPSSLESEASSYDNVLVSWFGTESSRINSLVSACSNDSAVQSLASRTSGLAAYASGCNATTTSGGSSSGTSASGAGATGSSTGGSSSNGAPTQIGLAAGAVAVAGFLGAMAML
ncbi:hypothetical protein BKA67DRAFT_586831 [Truncatella angustata]|uniref:Infection structure specific protein n=1 Tax=Truncatella angustata TaxID=152316 RepID=A0A9P8RFI1_9PEZI|nr:uncharacterized protein BKA67DRAFT_586831 [Truncatella angustata]KAH6645063.1 hypothetical protein BKA67DRAFT_586831 [Truncatella angustata]KAH8198428.1 hypothetical protein TruAng_007412 [Truncatella angustata]